MNENHLHLLIKNFRSLSGSHSIPLAPLTLVVGENSSGKSAFLAALSLLADLENFPLAPRFDAAPYNLGAYENIATFNPISKKSSASFALGFSWVSPAKKEEVRVEARYVNDSGQVRLKRYLASTPSGTLEVNFSGSRVSVSVRTESVGEAPIFRRSFRRRFHYPQSGMGILPVISEAILLPSTSEEGINSDLFAKLLQVTGAARFPSGKVFSVAPIRSKPRRTYDQFSDEFAPEGDHVPLRMERMLNTGKNQKMRRLLERALVDFGNSSGLFDGVEIRRLGSSSTSPLQLIILTGGLEVNIADVGYGVSQSLPIVVQSVLEADHEILLLQQPEVHLHPRAQAAMGSLFASLVGKTEKRFVIETHSDYIVDRIRQEVARGTLDPKFVAILFFCRRGYKTSAFYIPLDERGNVVDAPEEYRAFFLEEQLRTLTRGEDVRYS